MRRIHCLLLFNVWAIHENIRLREQLPEAIARANFPLKNFFDCITGISNNIEPAFMRELGKARERARLQKRLPAAESQPAEQRVRGRHRHYFCYFDIMAAVKRMGFGIVATRAGPFAALRKYDQAYAGAIYNTFVNYS